eukprot:4080374-Pyramimonas_sp.AAC.1
MLTRQRSYSANEDLPTRERPNGIGTSRVKSEDFWACDSWRDHTAPVTVGILCGSEDLVTSRAPKLPIDNGTWVRTLPVVRTPPSDSELRGIAETGYWGSALQVGRDITDITTRNSHRAQRTFSKHNNSMWWRLQSESLLIFSI